MSKSIVDEIEAVIKTVPEGPWFAAADEAEDSPPHKNSGLALVDTGRTSDWPIARLCEWNTAKYIAAVPPERLAALCRYVRATEALIETWGPLDLAAMSPELQAARRELGLEGKEQGDV